MHTLIFHTHIAALEPGTGLGLLVLPDPERDIDLVRLRPHGQAAKTISQQWFGSIDREHRTVLGQLSSIGWELPRDDDGNHAWFDAGWTSCCGRTMISLVGIDVDEAHVPVQTLVVAATLLRETAAQACHSTSQCRWLQRPISAPWTFPTLP